MRRENVAEKTKGEKIIIKQHFRKAYTKHCLKFGTKNHIMKTKPFLPFIFLCIANIKIFSQEHFRVFSSQPTTVQYLQESDGKGTTVIRDILVQIEFWSDNPSGAVDQTIKFEIQSATAATGSAPAISMKDYTLEKKKFKTEHDTVIVIVPVTITALPKFAAEFFTIGIQGLDQSQGGSVGVTIQEKPIEEKANRTPFGFAYMNAVNFDFDGTNGGSYVGHLNVHKYDAFLSKRKIKMGFNCGILKTNFSRQDSLQESTDYFENVLTHPLDEIKVGNEYLRQYNTKNNVTKNVAWSFYFQPNFSVVYQKNFKLLVHLHGEYFVNRWTTTTTITNYQQATGTFTNENIEEVKKDIGYINKFEKSLTDPVVTSNTITKGNFNFGAGITIDVNLWTGGSMFVQGTVGKAIDYVRPENVDPKTLLYTGTQKKTFGAHLARYILTQEITNNMEGIIGVEIRGKFGETPTYSSFIGINIGLNGLKKLLN